MGMLSILPEHLSVYETWIARIFLIFAALILGPWILFLVYDVLLYLWRSILYELPWIGGRARRRPRPRAPSLSERPSGHSRRISMPGISSRHGD